MAGDSAAIRAEPGPVWQQVAGVLAANPDATQAPAHLRSKAMTDSEQQNLQRLAALLATTDQLARRIRDTDIAQYEPGPGSPLAGDDREAGIFTLSAAAWNHLVVAADHLDTLRVATVGCAEHGEVTMHLHLFAQFTLLRSVIENAAVTLWLLSPAARDDRVLRRLRHATADIRNNESLRELIRQPGRKTRAQRLDQVRDAATSRGLDPKLALQPLRLEQVVREAGDTTEIGADNLLGQWRACSALAHGDLWASIAIPGQTRQPSARPGMADLHLSPNVAGLCDWLTDATTLADAALDLYEQRRQPPMLTLPGARPAAVPAGATPVP
ncbi:hypothetical protein [Dactylosporangium sp. CA-233914]|uniref:hypothetical protein n=1 Tax=Dactylosporangium sp. CA-233914 TaxID=3239934 RepID=UPI003D8A6E47